MNFSFYWLVGLFIYLDVQDGVSCSVLKISAVVISVFSPI